MSVPVNRVGTAELVGTSSAGTSARVLEGRRDLGVSPTSTSVPRRPAATVERVTTLSADIAANVLRVLPGVSARRTSTSVCPSHAVGPAPSAVFNVTRVMAMCASASKAGPDQDVKPVLHRAPVSTEDIVSSHRLQPCAPVYRYDSAVTGLGL